MLHGDALGLLLGAVTLGAIHGVEPGHGWPVAASYALDRANRWLYGFAAGFIIGFGHLVSSIAMVAAFFYAKSYFSLTQVNDPIALGSVDFVVWAGTVTIGGPVSIVAGVVLVALGVREYTHGHSHAHGVGDDHGQSNGHDEGHSHDHGDGPVGARDHSHDGHEHTHDEHGPDGHTHDYAHDGPGVRSIDVGGSDELHDGDSHNHDGGIRSRLATVLPFVGGHSHDHGDAESAAERGLWGIAWFAFLLGFAHEEEFEIIALCAGSNYCLELMSAYAVTVIVGIVSLTMLLIAGYQHFEERVEAYADYLPVFSAVVLVAMGLGFVTGLF